MALTTKQDIISEVLVRGQQSTLSGFITDEILNDWLKQSHRWASAAKKWPMTEGRVSTTYTSLVTDEDGELRGDYPEGWKPDSIRLLWIGGKRIRKLNFTSYKRFREDQPDAQDRVFTDYGRLYYVNPNADVSGTITAWGQYTPVDIDVTDEETKTIFSDIDDDGNEAIVEAMLARLKKRANKPKEAQNHMAEAVALLSGVWDRIKDEQPNYHMDDAGMFEYIDVLAGGDRDDLVRRDRWY